MTRLGTVPFVAVRAIALVLFVGSSLPAQGAWARVPPPPNSCFEDDDPFADVISKAQSDINAEVEPQKAYRAEMRQQEIAIDPMTKASRMTAYLQKDPAKAQQYMQMMGAGEPTNTEWTTKASELSARFTTIEKEYAAELKKLDPILAELRQKYGEDQKNPKALALIADWNARYQKLCETRIMAGPFAGWLKDTRDLQAQSIPEEVKNENRAKLQAEIMGVATTGFKSTAELEGVSKYLQAMQRVYAQRRIRIKPSY